MVAVLMQLRFKTVLSNKCSPTHDEAISHIINKINIPKLSRREYRAQKWKEPHLSQGHTYRIHNV